MAQETTFAARYLHEPHPVSNHPVGLPSGVEVSTPCGAVSTREICVFVPGLYLQRYGTIYDGNLSSPGVAGPRRWPKGQRSPRAASTSPIQSAITQWGYPVGLRFPHPAGRYRPGRYNVYLSPACCICRDMEGFLTRTHLSRVWRDLGVGPRDNFRRALPPRAPSSQQSPSGVTQWG